MVMLLFGFNDIANLVPVRPRPSSIHTQAHTYTDAITVQVIGVKLLKY